MARTKASVGAKVTSGKSSKVRAMAPPVSSYGSGSNGAWSSRTNGGGNPVCPRETPKWQKPITNFLIADTKAKHREPRPSGSSSSTNEAILEDKVETLEVLQNSILENDIELLPLTGENSHKIEEYFPKKEEQSMVKDDNKNLDIKCDSVGSSRKGSLKRDFSDISEDISENEDSTNKKIKV